MTQVFSNLLHNAAKFSDAGGAVQIDVQASECDERITVSIRDHGIGIAPDHIDSVFELFMQEKHRLARDFGGLGIGLSVVRSLVELHGGQVSVRSDGAGKGSEFVVTLPMQSPVVSIDRDGPGAGQGCVDRPLVGKAGRNEIERHHISQLDARAGTDG